MRYRRQSRSKSKQSNAVPALGALKPGPPMVRFFTPSELDLDSLAQTVRLLLSCENPPQLDILRVTGERPHNRIRGSAAPCFQ